MEIDAVDKLVFHVIEKVAEDECLLDEVVEFVISFSREHSLSPETLLKLSFIFVITSYSIHYTKLYELNMRKLYRK